MCVDCLFIYMQLEIYKQLVSSLKERYIFVCFLTKSNNVIIKLMQTSVVCCTMHRLLITETNKSNYQNKFVSF